MDRANGTPLTQDLHTSPTWLLQVRNRLSNAAFAVGVVVPGRAPHRGVSGHSSW
jgi:hypothetical protein